MKTILTFLILALTIQVHAQTIKTNVNTSGLQLKDDLDMEQIFLDGQTKCIIVHINDSLMWKIQGGIPGTITLINSSSQSEAGMRVDANGEFAFGEFDLILQEALQPVLNLSNGLFRPAPNTQALATANQERLRITDTGDIGIGTFIPEAKLHVNGTLRVSSEVRLETLPENSPAEEFLVVDIQGNVQKRFLPPFEPSFDGQEEVSLKLENQQLLIQSLLERIEVLEKHMVAKN